MKAIVCNNFGPIKDIQYKDVEDPKIEDNSVIIDVKSIGVNFPDGLLVQGKYQLKPETPFTPGMEVAGQVIEIGSKVSKFKIGDRVVGQSQLGGYAEKALVKESSVFNIPEKMSFDDSCALLCAYGTSHYALKQRGNLKKGELLVVLGASGSTGIAAIQIGKIMGAKVIGVASTEEKQKIAKENGHILVGSPAEFRKGLASGIHSGKLTPLIPIEALNSFSSKGAFAISFRTS